MRRCGWVNLKNPLYIKYHDKEWGKPLHEDKMLYELFILECFQAGLSWECVLNKRNHFRAAYDNFDIEKVVKYDENKVRELLSNKNIIRNELKIRASIRNSVIFKKIQEEFSSFDGYIWSFTGGRIIKEPYTNASSSPLSDKISKDLKKRGMTFTGSITVYSYMQSCGIINGHAEYCNFL